MATIESLIKLLNTKGTLKQDSLEILKNLSQLTNYAEDHLKLELLQNIDNKADDKFPSGKLVELVSTTGIFPVPIPYKKVEQTVMSYMLPYIEDASKTVQAIIPNLLSRSILVFLHQNKKSINTITRRYIYTDQLQIYKLDIKICYFKVDCACISNFLDTAYTIVGSKSTIDIKKTDFSALAHFYERQLLAHGISRNELLYLYNEIKDAYYRKKYPNSPFILR